MAVDCKVDVVRQECQLYFFCEEALALKFFECLNLFSVTLSRQNMDFTGSAMLYDEVLDVVGLPHGEVASSCADPEMWGVGHRV